MKNNDNDNYGNPKSDYINKLSLMTDEQLLKECDHTIWLSAYAYNNPHSDYHWQCDACYEETKKRDRISIYEQAYKQVKASI